MFFLQFRKKPFSLPGGFSRKIRQQYKSVMGQAFPRKRNQKRAKLKRGLVPAEKAVCQAGEMQEVEVPCLGRKGIELLVRHRGISVAGGASFSLVEKRSLNGKIVLLVEVMAPVEGGFERFKCIYDYSGNPIEMVEE